MTKESKNMKQLTLFVPGHPVKTSALLEKEREWMEKMVNCRSSFLSFLQFYGPAGWCGRTSPASCRQTADGTLEPLSGRWQNAGMVSPGESLTLSLSEWTGLIGQCPSDEGVCSLSDILETGDVPARYYLSAKACAGILRRAENRGKKLPAALEAALMQATEKTAATTLADR